MSRRYRIEITPATASASASQAGVFGAKQTQDAGLPAAFKPFFPMDSAPDGATSNTSFLDIELDLNSNSDSTMNQGSQMVTIRGVTPQMISQVNSLNGMQIAVYGGFAKGMPLATAMAATGFSPLVKGTIFGAIGNWVGTDLYISLPIIPADGVGIVDSSGSVQYPNLTINGKRGEKWSAVIARSLAQAMPNVKSVIDVRDQLVLSEDLQGTGYSLDALGQLWAAESKSILGSDPNYRGVWVAWRAGVLYITDNTSAPGTKSINLKAEQLLGNPAWTSPLQMQIVCPMRSDIYINDTVVVPQDALALAPATVTTGQYAAANNASASSLAGNYLVVGIRHLGRARSPEALDWATIIDLAYMGGATSTASTNDGTQPFGQKTGA
ncbi:hypothetical protein [Paraburkholderia tropica]|uniref:hypothetical protein n=1 Tax=Paraburkholderia tropica TaxID=92647 RepID=UPI002AAFCF96|nr:hypothetical protein [Paraburkholderia tropica]